MREARSSHVFSQNFGDLGKYLPGVSICPDLFSRAQILSWFASLCVTGAALISTSKGFSAPGFLVGRDLNCRDLGGWEQESKRCH